jgi:hypothetical protein
VTQPTDDREAARMHVTLQQVLDELLDRSTGASDLAMTWPDLGIDSFLATELAIRLEEVMPGIDPHDIDLALHLSSSPLELCERLDS